jgi:hypothetical protein
MKYGIDKLCKSVLPDSTPFQALSPIQKLKRLSDHFKSVKPDIQSPSKPSGPTPTEASNVRRMNLIRQSRTEEEQNRVDIEVEEVMSKYKTVVRPKHSKKMEDSKGFSF